MTGYANLYGVECPQSKQEPRVPAPFLDVLLAVYRHQREDSTIDITSASIASPYRLIGSRANGRYSVGRPVWLDRRGGSPVLPWPDRRGYRGVAGAALID